MFCKLLCFRVVFLRSLEEVKVAQVSIISVHLGY